MKRGPRPHSSSQLHFLWKKKLENLFYFLTKNGQPISGQDRATRQQENERQKQKK